MTETQAAVNRVLSSSPSAVPTHLVFTDVNRTNPVRLGLWSESVEHLQWMQREYTAQNDLFKLSQSVFLQAYGGFGLEALLFFLTDIFLEEIGDADPNTVVPMVTCYLKWKHTQIHPDNYPQLLTDLYNTCELVVVAKKNRSIPRCLDVCKQMLLCSIHEEKHNPDIYTVETVLDQLQQPNSLLKVITTILHWYDSKSQHLLQLFKVLRENYSSGEHEPPSKIKDLVSSLMLLHDQIIEDTAVKQKKQTIVLILTCLYNSKTHRRMSRQMDCVWQDEEVPKYRVTERVDIPKLFQSLFPSSLALPLLSYDLDGLTEDMEGL